MKGRIIPMIGLAAVFGALSIFIANIWLENAAEKRLHDIRPAVAQPEKPQIKFKTIVVAAQALDFGSRLDDSAVQEVPWPQDSLPEGAFLTIADLKKSGTRVVLRPIEKNEPILLTKLSGADGKAALSNLLRPGMRAVTLGLDEITGVGGYVTVGDHVDVVLTRKSSAPEGERNTQDNAFSFSDSGQVTETVLVGARVLSVGGEGADQSSRGRNVPAVTIEVTAQGAQKIALARSVGTLSLSLRPAADSGAAESIPEPKVVRADASDPVKVDTEKLSTVIVHRGLNPESYQVPTSLPAQQGQIE